MDRAKLRRRYHSLWTGEAFSALLFVAFLLWFANQDGVWQRWIARTYSIGVVIFILIQGIVWWRMKLRLLDHHQRQMSVHTLRVFRRWRRVNWILIGGFLLVVVIATQLTQQPLFSRDTWLGLLFLGGAVLEQINYYYVQLMYDSGYDWAYLRKHRRLRRGAIARSLDPHPAT